MNIPCASELRLRYGSTSTGGAELSETEDLVSFATAYRWLWLRNHWGKPRIYVPVPYARLALETEFTVPGSRVHRHMEGTFETGLEWMLTDTLGVSVRYGMCHQLIRNDDVHNGLMFRYELERTELATLLGGPSTSTAASSSSTPTSGWGRC